MISKAAQARPVYALICGSAKGIGQTLAQELLSAGYKVILLDREHHELEGAKSFSCDLADESALAAIIPEIEEIAPRLDYVFNCCGNYKEQQLFELSAEDFKATLNENLITAFAITKHCSALLSTGSTVVHITSPLGTIAEPAALAYSASKAALNMLVRCMALELNKFGAAVFAIAPGPVRDTRSNEEACGKAEAEFEVLNPRGRFLERKEVAEFILNLCSSNTEFLSGSIIPFSGGEESVGSAWSILEQVRGTGAVSDKPPLLSLVPSDQVRRSCRAAVQSGLQHIEIDHQGLKRFARAIEGSAVEKRSHWEADFHLAADHPAIVDYVFTVDCINFGCGYSALWKNRRTKSTYATVAAALKQWVLDGNELSARFASEVSLELIEDIFGFESGFEMASRFQTALHEMGSWVANQYGSYRGLLDSCQTEQPAQELIEKVTSNCACFDDRGVLNAAPLFLFKRAQILVHDLFLATRDHKPAFTQSEIANLTIFADNLVPHVLKKEGVLRFSTELEEKISEGRFLASRSSEELEIRAATIHACELLVAELRSQGLDLWPAKLDVFLWNIGQSEEYKSSPRHLCKSYYY